MIRIIGDVHGKLDQYIAMTKECDWSVQVGDMGFDYTPLVEVDHNAHRFVGGNHDNYDTYTNTPHSLGDYGEWRMGGVEFFFVRGSVSIDALPRVSNYILSGHKTWWYEEELSMEELEDAIDLYEQVKPDVMITHDCPNSIKDNFSSAQVMRHFGWPEDYACRTQQALSVMFQIHQPKLHFLGHWHRNWHKEINGTHFFVVDELSWLDLKMENDRYIVTNNKGHELANISAL